MTHYFLDETPGRRDLWRDNADMRPLPAADRLPCPEAGQRILILMHTRDLRAECDNDRTPATIVAGLRASLVPDTAFLYFSGAGDPWTYFNDLPGEGSEKPTGDLLQWIYEPGIQDRERAFLKRLQRLLASFDNDGSPPKWRLLYSSWREDAVDFLNALYLMATNGDQQRMRTFLEGHCESGPFGEQAWSEERPEYNIVGELNGRLEAHRTAFYEFLANGRVDVVTHWMASLPSLIQDVANLRSILTEADA